MSIYYKYTLNGTKTVVLSYVLKNISIKFYILQWSLDKVRTETMVKLCQKNARHVLIYSTDKYIKSTLGAVQYCSYVWTT